MKNLEAGCTTSSDNILNINAATGTMPQLNSLKGKKYTLNEARTTTNAEAAFHKNELSGTKDNPHVYIHNNQGKPPVGGLKGIVDFHSGKQVGQPYKVRTKLPFYDKQGKFQVEKIGNQNIQKGGNAGSPGVSGTFKMRSISHQ